MEGIQLGNSLTSSAIRAAMDRRNAAMQEMKERINPLNIEKEQATTNGPRFAEALVDGIKAADQKVREVDQLPVRVLQGEVELHEAAAQIQSSRIAFEFTMEVRNKFIDAYREVMRMSV